MRSISRVAGQTSCAWLWKQWYGKAVGLVISWSHFFLKKQNILICCRKSTEKKKLQTHNCLFRIPRHVCQFEQRATYPCKCKDCLILQMKHGSSKADDSRWLYCLDLRGWTMTECDSTGSSYTNTFPVLELTEKIIIKERCWLKRSGLFYQLKNSWLSYIIPS